MEFLIFQLCSRVGQNALPCYTNCPKWCSSSMFSVLKRLVKASLSFCNHCRCKLIVIKWTYWCVIKYSILIYFHGQFSTNFLYLYCLSQVCSSLACFSFESLFSHPSFYLGFFYCPGWKVDYKLQLPRVRIEFSFVMPWKAFFSLKYFAHYQFWQDHTRAARCYIG